MRLNTPSGSVLVRGRAHWQRCGFENAALFDDVIVIAPADLVEQTLEDATPFSASPAGLAFDRRCRLFHNVPDTALLEVVLWERASSLLGAIEPASPFTLEAADGEPGALPKSAPALASDDSDFLYVADPLSGAVWAIDVWQQELSKRFALPGKPLDLAARGADVFVLLDGAPGWGVLGACQELESLSWPEGLGAAARLDCAGNPRGGGDAFVLVAAGAADAAIVKLADTRVRVVVPFCTDFAIGADDPDFGWLFVAARRPGEDLRRFHFKQGVFHALSGLYAPHYDGRGIVLTPEGNVAYFSQQGVRQAAPARTEYRSASATRVYGYALDSERDGNVWGVLRVEACIPEGTAIVVHAFTRDDLDFDDPLPRLAPVSEPLAAIAEPAATPLPSSIAWQHRAALGQALYRASAPRLLDEKPVAGFAQYDAPILAEPGRYLWLVFELVGSRHRSPRLREARVAFPGHQLLRLLPKTLWRDGAARDFLTRFLTPLSTFVTRWGDLSSTRQRLLDPRVCPAETLDWLASFVALSMDACWSERARRQMLAEVATLFDARGTLWGLTRMLEILTGAEVLILEHFRLRGGGVGGNPEATSANAVLGVGFRVGGEVGDPTQSKPIPAQGFDDFAHRFTVTVVATLSEEQLRCATRLVEAHKPAHTQFDLCSAARGSRVGLGLHVGVASVIADSGGFARTVVGDAVPVKGYLLGRPALDPSSDGSAARGSS